MKYTKEERLDIGRRIYDGEMSRYEAAEEYGICSAHGKRQTKAHQAFPALEKSAACSGNI